MKFAILLLFCCCAVALARPDGSKEVAKPSSKEANHSGVSKESSNESGKEDDGGVNPGSNLIYPSIQMVELVLDRVVGFAASIIGLNDVDGFADLIHLIESNPIGNVIWTGVIRPFLQNIVQYKETIISYLSYLQSGVLNYFPISQLLMPLKLPASIIQFVLSILHDIAEIFSRPI
ncbi:uncharacterized protein LOC143207165 [Lasioglossum baleicum]|uniref:uncharacterized protein LOC143207165 n=1 Tax=Lasioglossum baleicum TaxID=434251 RepID=UPI003FCE04F9